jgi:short-subunit dehydrogenase
MASMDLNQKNILITGASSGIGDQLAKQLAAKGATVALVARREDKLSSLQQIIQSRGGTALIYPADLSITEQCYTTVARAAKEMGHLDMLIANAGVGIMMQAHKMKPGQIDRMLQVNLQGAIHSLLAGLQQMLGTGGGQLVGISSLAGFRGMPQGAVYCATKAGLITFLESLRVDYAHKNIRVTTICPGFVHTPMTEKNTQPMPFALSAEKAGHKIIAAIEAEKKMFAFPTPLGIGMRMAALLPNPIYDRLINIRP